MKKALHDALGYLWVKNSVEAEKKRKADIAQENARFQANVDAKWEYVYATKYWGTTELGYFCHISAWLSLQIALVSQRRIYCNS